MNKISNLEYGYNYELSFEYKASFVPSNGSWHQILLGKFSLFIIETIIENLIPYEFTKRINSKVSPDGGSDMFAFYCGHKQYNYAITGYGAQINFNNELDAEKWYKVGFAVLLLIPLA